jgi:hypothetical protein
MSTAAATAMISEAQKRQYQDEGYFILERAIPEAMLALLREECANFIGKRNSEMDAAGVNELGSDIRDNRYFIANRYRESERLKEFVFSELMAEICRATIGPDAYLFYEQWVIKGEGEASAVRDVLVAAGRCERGERDGVSAAVLARGDEGAHRACARGAGHGGVSRNRSRRTGDRAGGKRGGFFQRVLSSQWGEPEPAHATGLFDAIFGGSDSESGGEAVGAGGSVFEGWSEGEVKGRERVEPPRHQDTKTPNTKTRKRVYETP